MRTEGFRGVLLSTLVIASLITPLLLLSPSPVHAALTPHAPISINGNGGFTSPDPVNGGGSGTLGDPYIIENYIIDASTAHGIEIRNTTAYFVVRNSVVENGGRTYHGIHLGSVVNGKVENNTCDNNGAGISLDGSNNNTIENNTCENNLYGIDLRYSDRNIISNNTANSNRYGGIVWLLFSSYNVLENNITNSNGWGIIIGNSSYGTLKNNSMENNTYNFHIIGLAFPTVWKDQWTHWIDTSNTVNGKPIYYIMNSRNQVIDSLTNAGFVAFIFCDNITVKDLNLSNNRYGVLFLETHNSIIRNNDIVSNYLGVVLWHSDNNIVYHNNMINNPSHQGPLWLDLNNYWDDGYPSGGNYWSDYTGIDENKGENQDIPGSDGIGDTPHYIPKGPNPDRYPLMSPWSPALPVIPATIDINPDTLNLKSRGRWITAYIELPSGYSVENIDVSTVRLIVDNDNVPAEPKPMGIGDHDNDGIADRMVKFSRSAVQALAEIGEVEMTVIGKVAGLPFECSDTIRVLEG